MPDRTDSPARPPVPFWQSHGTDGPALLFVHGFRCDGSDWDGLVSKLAPRFRCAVPDLPGHGRTAPFDEGRMETLAEAVNAVRAGLGEVPVILIGHSLGAKVIREAYRQSPEGVAGMILVDGSLYVKDRDTMMANASHAVAGGMEAFLKGLFGRMFFAPQDTTWLKAVMQRATSGDLDYARRLFLASVDWDAEHAHSTLGMINVPTMIIQATTFDENFGWRQLRPGETTPLIDAARRKIADCRIEIIEDAGHFVMRDARDRVADVIGEFAEAILSFGSAPQNKVYRNG